MTSEAAARPGDIALVEPARQQVIALASDLLGRLPAEDVPVSLRPFARFAPAKRRRLGAAVLAAVLDADDGFRGKVAEAVEQTSQELVAAVREGRTTPAADPVDIAVVAYLTRPDGWADAVAQANARWNADRGATAAAGDETARLRAELVELRAQGRGEKARLRDAVARAGEETQAELATLRQGLRDRTRELRAAERERDAARAAGADLEAGLAKERTAHEAELRRLRGRIAETERLAEAARRGARVERDVDDSRLWLLVDTLVQAANGVRRELSLPAPTARPADAVASAGVDGGGRRANDPAALDRLLALPNVHVVIDGYNVTKTGYGELSLADQRTRLVGSVAPIAAQSGAEITVVFDGGNKPPVQPSAPRGIRVLFSAADEIADDLIRRLVAGEPAGRPVVVVTSDQQVVRDTARDGAWSVPSVVFLTRLA
ncbi:MAG TPA: NYN domain-containing protein [Jatrophihabitans sp.]|uniref:NYN domain-containing protein n=1 Tax=Jatrophihabitans sp. TaxID=1932789 RepID=UPI002DF81CFA|nr:NYN domain-containing protein [Jatrophihabitans sp.]